MIEISIGAVGAAVVAGVFSIISLIISKELKVSEFRYSWINELRQCLISYVANINAISDTIRINKANQQADKTSLLPFYKALNEASHGIEFRINADEQPSARLLKSMRKFEDLAKRDANLSPENIEEIERSFKRASKQLLKFEWQRVKRGERVFVTAKWILMISTMILFLLFIYGAIISNIIRKDNIRSNERVILAIANPPSY